MQFEFYSGSCRLLLCGEVALLPVASGAMKLILSILGQNYTMDEFSGTLLNSEDLDGGEFLHCHNFN